MYIPATNEVLTNIVAATTLLFGHSRVLRPSVALFHDEPIKQHVAMNVLRRVRMRGLKKGVVHLLCRVEVKGGNGPCIPSPPWIRACTCRYNEQDWIVGMNAFATPPVPLTDDYTQTSVAIAGEPLSNLICIIALKVHNHCTSRKSKCHHYSHQNTS